MIQSAPSPGTHQAHVAEVVRPDRSFDTVLVANRGEIAVRVIRTLRRLGITSVAVYSDADAEALHVREADRAERIGPAPAAESYLDIEAVVEACRRSGAQAVHPGYGFLSENAEFARALEAAGITFIGPTTSALHAMGDKIRAKGHVGAHGVPLVPGIAEPGLDDERLVAAAEDIGYPVLIKPSAGGGGKGMVAVHSPEELPDALAAARRTARSAFGDETLFLERLVSRPRHIEVQVLADTYGNTVHLAERECSLQRRHQKVIEEAPAPLLEALPGGAALRERLGAAAVDAARSVGYRGAGTVEFLVSDDRPDDFFFMEMNTRLQVEHPVTEEVVRWEGRRLDLVEWQVRIAAGESLPFTAQDLSLHGHAIEARVYAEDPATGFLPAVGPVADTVWPAGSGVRVDAALDGPGDVSSHYDPMIAKVITHGADRAEALRRLDTALAGTAVVGLTTNVPYLRELLADSQVRDGALHTAMLDERPAFVTPEPDPTALLAAAQALTESLAGYPAQHPVGPGPQRLGAVWGLDGWRLGPAEPARVTVEVGGDSHTVTLPTPPAPPAAAAETAEDAEDNTEDNTLAQHRDAAVRTAVQDGIPVAHVVLDGQSLTARLLPRAEQVARRLETLRRERTGVPVGPGSPVVASSLPGTVVSLAVQDGQTVTSGQPVGTVEAMKMEHAVVAQSEGVIRLQVAVGDQVRSGQALATIEPAAEAAAPDPDAGTPESTPDATA